MDANRVDSGHFKRLMQGRRMSLEENVMGVKAFGEGNVIGRKCYRKEML